jgi:GNAT superfamily N-acetyltransferase
MRSIPAGYQVGRAHPHELADLIGIEIAAAALFSPEDLAVELRQEGLPLSFFERALSEGRLWVARSLEPPAPVGFAAAMLLDASAHLHEMDLLPAHGRRGLGRALLDQVIDWAQASGFATLTLTTFRHLPWNAPFYASTGFVEIADRDLGPQLRAALEEEAKHGLDPSKRVAMKLDLLASGGVADSLEPSDE